MSTNVVVPDSIISRAARRVPTRTKSGETVLASAGKMYFCSQSFSARSSARPRKRTIGACVWPLMSPGMMTCPRASTRSAASYFAVRSSVVPTSTMRSPLTATAPLGITRSARSMVTRVPPDTMSDTGCRACPRSDARTATTMPRAAMSRRNRDARMREILYSFPVAVHLVRHPVAQDALLGLRSASTCPSRFRRLARRLGTILAIEATRDLATSRAHVDGPLERADGDVLQGEIVAVPVLRAGLGLLESVLDVLPEARVGHIGLARDECTAVAAQY